MFAMWMVYASASALFAGITAILSKCGIKNTDSTVATAIRTVVVLVFSWLLAFISSPPSSIGTIAGRTWLFLILSGLSTGASWLCYFHALQKGDINKVVPIDKSSTVLTMVLAIIFLDEMLTPAKIAAILLIGAGTLMMVEKKKGASAKAKGPWMLYALLSAVFASITSILGKIGIEGIDSNLGTAIRTSVVLVMAWVMVLVSGKEDRVKEIGKNELFFIILSGFVTGASWLCYYKALQDGPASVVVPIDKLSILATIIFSRIVFKERLTKKSAVGLVMIVIGTLLLAIRSFM